MRVRIFWCMMIVFLTGCGATIEKLKRIGQGPDLAIVDLPAPADEEVEEYDMKRRDNLHIYMRKTNSLWQPGSTSFFRDNRAWKIGDIVTVSVIIKDSAKLDNSTQGKRTGSDTLGATSLFCKEKAIAHAISSKGTAGSLIGTNTTRNHSGSGNISRQENIQTSIAATVIKILPSGNLVIQGHQEVRVNFELREIKVAGIIRPKDIDNNNSINSSQMAEARISYGGRGIVSDVQQPRIGSQIIDVLAPF